MTDAKATLHKVLQSCQETIQAQAELIQEQGQFLDYKDEEREKLQARIQEQAAEIIRMQDIVRRLRSDREDDSETVNPFVHGRKDELNDGAITRNEHSSFEQAKLVPANCDATGRFLADKPVNWESRQAAAEYLRGFGGLLYPRQPGRETWIPIVKEVRRITGWGLGPAKDFVSGWFDWDMSDIHDFSEDDAALREQLLGEAEPEEVMDSYYEDEFEPHMS